MKYPFGKCAECGYEFNSELRNEYRIEYCPKCGTIIHDYFSDMNPAPGLFYKPDPEKYIYCEDCGRRIYERSGKNNEGGNWIDEEMAGVCSGPCERELCGSCADWDDEGCCIQCHPEYLKEHI
jgi:DNA-directed RNA polymerase subunit RPC12/RpoP